jgi:hypothetical protein
LALSFLGDADAHTSIEVVANKYLAFNRPALAAAAFAETGQEEKALHVFMDSGDWEEARALALKVQDAQLTKTLESRYKDFLRTQGKVEQVRELKGHSLTVNSKSSKCFFLFSEKNV